MNQTRGTPKDFDGVVRDLGTRVDRLSMTLMYRNPRYGPQDLGSTKSLRMESDLTVRLEATQDEQTAHVGEFVVAHQRELIEKNTALGIGRKSRDEKWLVDYVYHILEEAGVHKEPEIFVNGIKY